MAAAPRRDGIVSSFEIFSVFNVTPLGYREYGANQIVDFLLHEDEHYVDTCPKLAASINYTDHTIMISMVNDEVMETLNAGASDSLFEFTIDDDKWERVVEDFIGTFEYNKDILTQGQVNAALENRKAEVPGNVERLIKSYLGGKRKTRKPRKTRKMHRRKN